MAHASLEEYLVIKEGKYMLGKMPYTHYYIFYNGDQEIKKEFIKDNHYELQIKLLNCRDPETRAKIQAEIIEQPSYIRFRYFVEEQTELYNNK